jgi:S1-C subfamily serine protease
MVADKYAAFGSPGQLNLLSSGGAWPPGCAPPIRKAGNKSMIYKFRKSTRRLLLIFSILLLTACSAVGATVDFTSDLEADDSQGGALPEQVTVGYSLPIQDTVDTPVSEAPGDSYIANDLEASLIQLYQRANPSVVYILTSSGSGSGFVYSQDGMIVTNNHVVAGSRNLEVVFSNGERLEAELVGADIDSDLAVIQVEALPEGVSPLPLAQDEAVQVGQLVVAIGNPFGEQGSMSLGIVSGLGRSLPSQRMLTTGSAYLLPEVVQTDAPINPGNSGGPLLNLQGQVVGVTSAIASETGANTGVGFSIPVKAVRRIVPQLLEAGEYEYGYLGAGFDGEITLSDQAIYGLEQTQGVYVVNVTPGSPAEQAGLTAANPDSGRGGDLVIAIDGQPVGDFGDLNSYLIFETAPGQTITLTVLRGEETVEVGLTLGARP